MLILVDYHSHWDGQFLGYVFAIPGNIICAIGIVRALKRKNRSLAVAYAAALVSCVFFCWWITRIPFCTMCDGLRKSDLGFMLRPFADRFGDGYLPE